MHMTPLEIKKQEFHRQVRGYKPEDVHIFLEMVANDVEQLLHDRIVLESRVGMLESELAEFREIESSLRDAMLMASQARDRAQERAEVIVLDAERKREDILAEGESLQSEMLSGVDHRREELAFEVETLERQHRFIIERVREFVDDQRVVLDEHAAAAEEASRARRPKKVDAQVVSLAKVSSIASNDDEDLSRGAEAS
jgi:cell division initiation protein